MTDRAPSLSALALGEWSHSWDEWTTEDNRVIVWIEALPPIDEGDTVQISYEGPQIGETAHEFDVPITRIEAAHGGFHLVFDTGGEFIDEIIAFHPSEAVGE